MLPIQQTEEFINQINETFNPFAWVWLFSGGDDSLCAGMVTNNIIPITHAVHCDTGTGIPETKEFVMKTCQKLNIPLLVGTTSQKDSYEHYVKKFGFPGQNIQQHQVMYRMLKSHSLSRCIAKIRERKKNRNIILISGARSDESIRRMGTVQPYRAEGSNIWVNPIHHWLGSDCSKYLRDNQIKRNPVAEIIGRSGECNCGVFGSRNEILEIGVCFPRWKEWITNLEAEVKSKGFTWGWGESPNQDWINFKKGQRQIPIEGLEPEWWHKEMFLCTTCMNNPSKALTAISRQEEKAIEEFNLLEEVSDKKTALQIGKLLKVMKNNPSNQKIRLQKIDELLEEFVNE